ncbi:DUF4418 family protein [Mageeibacillus indolicus]|uniref:DUF4418 domain-containing protein n=2 Tax=Mageeibacillus indolicus TaxID=884684 RepID=D3R071_MAGIU|nr:DUF4418 family protein [Mageeibacillus indolicus]ADC90435.1 hypothetical protein HMPREF0868_0240 [Mageeibacillus indolicus UPII9-5]KFA57145.1 hypothetical protein HMPREF1632_05480 [Mageeibacillus indolicus 0009-5]PNH18895.1 hypothetical protein B7R76_04915 [Mageeibacillus indolicus]
MHKEKCLKSISLIQVIMGIIVAAMSFVLVPVCGPMPNGKYMSCHYTGILITVAGVVLIVLALINYLVKNGALNKVLAIVQIVVAALSYMIPSKIIPVAIGVGMNGKTRYIGLCMKPMQCWNSFHASSVCLLIVVILALIYLAVHFVMKKD